MHTAADFLVNQRQFLSDEWQHRSVRKVKEHRAGGEDKQWS